MTEPSTYALDAAMQIVPQYVTGPLNVEERLQYVDSETLAVAKIIQDAIDRATDRIARRPPMSNAEIDPTLDTLENARRHLRNLAPHVRERTSTHILAAVLGVVDQRDIEIRRLRSALVEVAKREGAFSRDPLTHANSTIENMASIAEAALSSESPR